MTAFRLWLVRALTQPVWLHWRFRWLAGLIAPCCSIRGCGAPKLVLNSLAGSNKLRHFLCQEHARQWIAYKVDRGLE